MKYSEEAALARLAAKCSTAEYCTHDIEEKMKRWELDETAIARIMERLTAERYVDNERYCRAFIKEKMTFNRWGRRKIEEALYSKRIPKTISDKIFGETDKNCFSDTLRDLLSSRRRTIKAKDDYDMRNKLIRFALQRGFSMDETLAVIENL